eukprot:5431973-Pleurochrysis_carterae.AAC.7
MGRVDQFQQYRLATLHSSSLGIRTHDNGGAGQRASALLSWEAARPDRASVSRARPCQSMSSLQASGLLVQLLACVMPRELHLS